MRARTAQYQKKTSLINIGAVSGELDCFCLAADTLTWRFAVIFVLHYLALIGFIDPVKILYLALPSSCNTWH